ncbi:DUF1287 domain-containing protein [Thalassomonas viridans]|uniref:DUF1287 domain-containing protein n=1 Tax=Thalassomonas viridans TaxID=137584 RepID=A0AAE9Z5K4_9GAMM|nr:DUF1287 domain-containing protein [Thalassomonas viridans]WDE06469.1 DUF1287 domain-containing protein [Thalassomonas viridans]
MLTVSVCAVCLDVSALNFEQDIVEAAHERTKSSVRYDGAYVAIDYPWGDVPKETGVCTDVVIRSYRKLGTDLQQLVHEDMSSSFSKYPSKRIWGLKRPDKNIDHRRVPNLQAFFKRHGLVLAVTRNPKDYKPGNLVTWMLPGNLPHIGIVSDQLHSETGNPMIVHNIGNGPELEDILFGYKITGHYKYVPEKYNKTGQEAH